MRVLDLVHHILVDIGNGDFPTSRRVSNHLLCTLYLSFLLLMGLRLLLILLLGCFVYSLVPSRLVLVQIFDELPDGRDWVMARVMPSRSVLLLL